MNTSNLKDLATTIFGFVFSIATAILTYASSASVTLPTWANAVLGGAITVSGFVIFFLTGKNPDGTSKTPNQVVAANSGNAPTTK